MIWIGTYTRLIKQKWKEKNIIGDVTAILNDQTKLYRQFKIVALGAFGINFLILIMSLQYRQLLNLHVHQCLPNRNFRTTTLR